MKKTYIMPSTREVCINMKHSLLTLSTNLDSYTPGNGGEYTGGVTVGAHEDNGWDIWDNYDDYEDYE